MTKSNERIIKPSLMLNSYKHATGTSSDFDKLQKFWNNLRNQTEKTNDVVNEALLHVIWGLSPAFQQDWINKCRAGVVYVGRAKPIALILENGQRIQTINTRLDESVPKPTTISSKSSGAASGPRGRVEVRIHKNDSRYEFSGVRITDAGRSVITINDKVSGNVYHATYDRQDLAYIRSQIDAGSYELLDCVVPESDVIGSLTILDGEGAVFMVEIQPQNKRLLLTRSDSVKSPMSNLREQFDRTGRKPSYSANLQLRNKFAAFIQSNEFRMYQGEMVNFIPCDPETREPQRIPNVYSDSEGIPIKGDVDLQHTFLPNNLPIYALRFIKIKDEGAVGEAIAGIENLLVDLKRLNYDKKIIEAAQKALENLNAYAKANPGKYAILSVMGNINLFNAAMVLGTDNPQILHGDESGSIYIPEPIIVSHIPNSEGIVRCTYGEFEYLEALITGGTTNNMLISFNPCWLVKDEPKEGTNRGWWRQPTMTVKEQSNFGATINVTYSATRTIDDRGVEHSCDNLADEQFSIQLWRNLFQKQLLEYKNSHSKSEFQEFISAIKFNHARILSDANNKASQNPGDEKFAKFVVIASKGINVVNELIKSCDRPEINILERIKELNLQSNKIIKKRNAEKIMMGTTSRTTTRLPRSC